jgi:hypothetical protein
MSISCRKSLIYSMVLNIFLTIFWRDFVLAQIICLGVIRISSLYGYADIFPFLRSCVGRWIFSANEKLSLFLILMGIVILVLV